MKPLNLSQSSDETVANKGPMKTHKGKDDGRSKSAKTVMKTEVVKPSCSKTGIPALPSGENCACITAKAALLSGPQHPPKFQVERILRKKE